MARARRLPGWGWLEWGVVAQTAMPALMFVPGLGGARTLTRVAAFGIALAAWGATVLGGRRSTGRAFPPAIWLAGCAGWIGVMVVHPNTNSLLSGGAAAMLNLAILSPAFWGGPAVRDSRQLGRLMAILLACNAASTVVGIGQYYQPERFRPPSIPLLSIKEGVEEQLSFTTADGRRVLRLCGLTDTPGAAGAAGSIACLVGLCWALRPVAAWKRIACLGLSLAGAAVVYLGQARLPLATLAIGLMGLVGLLAYRGDRRRAGLLAVAATAVLGLGLLWVFRSAGEGAVERFRTLLDERPGELIYANRGHFLEDLLRNKIWEYPLGAGLGRWGMVYLYFGDRAGGAARGELYAEVQWTAWVLDGGIPLMVGYGVAVVLALANSARVARTCPDESVGFWAAAVCALGLNVLAATFGSMPFIGPDGVQFWALMAAVHAADRRARLAAVGAPIVVPGKKRRRR